MAKVKQMFGIKRVGKKKEGRFGIYVQELSDKPSKKGQHKQKGYRLIQLFVNAAIPENAEADALHVMREMEKAAMIDKATVVMVK